MFGVGTQEIIIILVIALVVFGPKKLPEIGKALGQGLRELKKATRDIAESVKVDIETEEPIESNQPDKPKEDEINKEEAK
jgi:sec-independent protein translocase protein TatA